MKTTRKLTALLLVLLLTFSAVYVNAAEYKQRFWDVSKTHWAFEYIADLTLRGVISGYEDGSFKPDATVSRGEWAKLMCIAGNLSIYDNNVYFRDTKNHWSNAYVNAARNYITCYSDNSFRPDQAIVREDVTRSLVVLKGYDISDVDYSHITSFKDFNSISNNMKAYVAVAVEKGLITGFEDNTFRGQATLTRAEAAVLLYRAYQLGDQTKTTNLPSSEYVEPEITIPELSVNENKVVEDVKSTETTESEEVTTETESDDADYNSSEMKSGVISEVNVTAADQIATDGESKVWYLKDGIIYSSNIYKNDHTEVFDINKLEIDTEIAYKTNFELYSLAYDPLTEGIIVYGEYKTVNSSMDKASRYIYLINEDVEILFSGDAIHEDFSFIFGLTSDGNFIDEDTIWSRKDLKPVNNYVSYVRTDNSGLVMWGTSCTVANKGKALYFVGEYSRDNDSYSSGELNYVSKYTKDSTEQLWEANGQAFAISDKFVGIYDEDNSVVNVYSLLGKELTKVNIDEDAEIKYKFWIVGDFIVYVDAITKTLVKVMM